MTREEKQPAIEVLARGGISRDEHLEHLPDSSRDTARWPMSTFETGLSILESFKDAHPFQDAHPRCSSFLYSKLLILLEGAKMFMLRVSLCVCARERFKLLLTPAR